MQVYVRWIGDMSFVAETGSGHSIVMDTAPESGGRNMASRPMEMVLAGLGGCSSFDIVDLLRKAGQDIRTVELQLKAQRATSPPKVFTEINGHFIVKGKNIDAAQVDIAVKRSATQLSSVAKMLDKSVVIHWDWEVIEE